MVDESIYEVSHPSRVAKDNAFCLGRITAVDPVKRLCTVKTFFASHKSLNDQHIPGCQWLNWDASIDGDESTSIPRRLSIAVVIFIQSVPYIFGYIKGLDRNTAAVTGNEQVPLVEGDKILSTRSGNRITVRASGLVEIFVAETLKSFYLPTRSEVIHLCRNYQLKSDGGSWLWQTEKETLDTLSSQIFRSNIANLFAVFVDQGAVSADTIHSFKVAPGLSKDTPIYSHEIDISGESRLEVGLGEPLYTATIGADGSWEVEAVAGITFHSTLGKIVIEADTDDVEVRSKGGSVTVESEGGDVTVHASTGDVSVEADAGDVSVTATAGDVALEATAGDVTMNGSQGMLKLSGGQVGLGGPTAEVVDLISQMAKLGQGICTAIGNLTVLGNMGYPTSPPINVADFVQLAVQCGQVQALAEGIKGGV